MTMLANIDDVSLDLAISDYEKRILRLRRLAWRMLHGKS